MDVLSKVGTCLIVANLSVKTATGTTRTGKPYKPMAVHRLKRQTEKARKEGALKFIKKTPLRCVFNPRYVCDETVFPSCCPPNVEQLKAKGVNPKAKERRPCQ